MSGGAAAAQAAINNAIKASGSIIKIDESDFRRLISRLDDGLVVEKIGGTFFSNYKYSTHYKGFTFYCSSKEQIVIPSRLEKINARSIWTPQ